MSSDADRKDTRVTIRLGAEIETAADTFTAYTKDLSSSGAALVCERPVHDGEQLRISLFLVYDGVEDERTPPLITAAKVQWAVEADDGSHTAGIHFDGMTPAQTEWLARIVAVSAGT
jgi:c-di-GMP-binding flagellar brake protein YcgR